MPRLATARWFLERPWSYGQLGRVAATALAQRLPGARRRQERASRSRSFAEAWCRAQAIKTAEALEILTSRRGHVSVYTAHQQEFRAAEARAADVPVALGGPGNLDLIHQLAEHLGATRVVETGVAYGWSSLALLLSLSRRPGSALVSTDLPYAFPHSERYVGIVVPDHLRGIWTVIARPDRTALPRAGRLLPEFDLCHYDSDKSYRGRLWAYRFLWGRLRLGGMFMSDDVHDNLSFQDFAAEVERPPMIVVSPAGDKYTGVLTK